MPWLQLSLDFQIYPNQYFMCECMEIHISSCKPDLSTNSDKPYVLILYSYIETSYTGKFHYLIDESTPKMYCCKEHKGQRVFSSILYFNQMDGIKLNMLLSVKRVIRFYMSD